MAYGLAWSRNYDILRHATEIATRRRIECELGGPFSREERIYKFLSMITGMALAATQAQVE
jgi:hypothetical protein